MAHEVLLKYGCFTRNIYGLLVHEGTLAALLRPLPSLLSTPNTAVSSLEYQSFYPDKLSTGQLSFRFISQYGDVFPIPKEKIGLRRKPMENS